LERTLAEVKDQHFLLLTRKDSEPTFVPSDYSAAPCLPAALQSLCLAAADHLEVEGSFLAVVERLFHFLVAEETFLLHQGEEGSALDSEEEESATWSNTMTCASFGSDLFHPRRR